jgi:hypothetical protein
MGAEEDDMMLEDKKMVRSDGWEEEDQMTGGGVRFRVS